MDTFNTVLSNPSFLIARTKATIMANILADNLPILHVVRTIWTTAFADEQPVPKSTWELISQWMMDPISVSRVTVYLVALFAFVSTAHYGYLVWSIYGTHFVSYVYGSKLA
jgi:hypothetical protein